MSAPLKGYLLSEDNRYRLERVKGTLQLIEHLASTGDLGSHPGRHDIRWEELAALLSLVSCELSAVLTDSEAPARADSGQGGGQ